MATGQNYGYDQPGDAKIDPRNAGYDQPAPPPYSPSGNPYANPRGPPVNSHNVNIVMTQPQPATTIIVNPRPEDYFAWSIFTMLCCCFPIGIAALIFSVNSRSASDNLNYEQARRDSRTSRILNIFGLIFGLIIFIVLIVLYSTTDILINRGYYSY